MQTCSFVTGESPPCRALHPRLLAPGQQPSTRTVWKNFWQRRPRASDKAGERGLSVGRRLIRGATGVPHLLTLSPMER